MNSTLKTIATVALIGVVLLPLNGPGAGYLKIGDIKGESTDDGHKEWINLVSISQGIEVERAAGSGLPTGKRQHKPFVFSKPIDKATPKLMESCTQGKVIPQVRLEFVTPGTRQLYYQIVMSDVLVTSYQTGGTAADPVPTESFSLNYEKIKWTYTEFDRAGQPARDHAFYWNLLENVGETDELPPGSFRVSSGGEPTPTGDVLKVRWNGFEEFIYRIRGSETVDGNYGFIQDYTPAADGAQELELPLNLPKMFIQIEKLPLPE